METKRNATADVLSNPLVKQILGSFTFGPRTHMRAGRINNKDFITLCLLATGPLGLRELRALSQAWRGSARKLDSYFGPHYGHTATDIGGAKRYSGPHCSSRHPMAWYRAVPSKGSTRYANALTHHGLARAQRLALELSQ